MLVAIVLFSLWEHGKPLEHGNGLVTRGIVGLFMAATLHPCFSTLQLLPCGWLDFVVTGLGGTEPSAQSLALLH